MPPRNMIFTAQCYAERCYATVCRLSVCFSVRLLEYFILVRENV